MRAKWLKCSRLQQRFYEVSGSLKSYKARKNVVLRYYNNYYLLCN